MTFYANESILKQGNQQAKRIWTEASYLSVRGQMESVVSSVSEPRVYRSRVIREQELIPFNSTKQRVDLKP